LPVSPTIRSKEGGPATKNIKKGPFSGRKTIEAYFEASEGEGLLPELVSSTVEDWRREKHRGATAEEIRMINGAKPESCPFCGSAHLVSEGKRKDGVARFL